MTEETQFPNLKVKHFLSIKEAATYLQCSRSSLYKRIKKKNGIPHKRLGTKILVPLTEFMMWVSQSKIP